MKKCPVCDSELKAKSDFPPFCSKRCKLVDLEGWLSGRYSISTPVHESDDPEEIEDAMGKIERSYSDSH